MGVHVYAIDNDARSHHGKIEEGKEGGAQGTGGTRLARRAHATSGADDRTPEHPRQAGDRPPEVTARAFRLQSQSHFRLLLAHLATISAPECTYDVVLCGQISAAVLEH